MLELWQAAILLFFWIAVLDCVYRLGWNTATYVQQAPCLVVCEVPDAN